MKTLIFILLLVFVTGDDCICSEEQNNSIDDGPVPKDVDIIEMGLITKNHSNKRSMITGGEPAYPGMFPFQVAILIFMDKSSRYFFCGGVLISRCFVLTAAHCCQGARSFTIILGATNFRTYESTQIRINTTVKIIHPRWNNQTLENDICLIFLPDCVTFTDFIKPIQFWNKTKAETIDCYATVCGWGKTNDSSMYINDNLRYITVRVIPIDGSCGVVYSPICNTNICTESENGRSPCNGDSGGPLIITDDDGIDYLLGIVSYGNVKGCQLLYPTVYVYVRCYLKWVLKVMVYYTPDPEDNYECDGTCV